MIDATRRWFRRNRANLVIGAGVIGAGYLAGQYVLGKIQEARQRMGEERVAKENLRRRFEQNQEDCTYTVLALLPTVRDEIIGSLPVEQITEQLQLERQERLRKLNASEAASSDYPSAAPSEVDDDGKSLAGSSFVHASQMGSSSTGSSLVPKRSKAQLWQDMKINAITRAITLIYTLALLTILTRIQLNLLGRRTYLSSVVALATPVPAAAASSISLENKDDDNYENFYGNDFETNRKFLTFSWWLLHRGSRLIMERVMAAVKDVFGKVNIREDLTLERLGDLVMQVRRKIEGETEAERHRMRWLVYLLPPTEEEAFVIRQAGMSEGEESPSPDARTEDFLASSFSQDEPINGSLRRLLDETSDLIDSPTFTQVITRLLDSGYSRLVDHHIAIEAFKAAEPPVPGTEFQVPRVVDVTDNKCKLAHVLPVFCKQAHTISAGSGELDVMAGVAAQAPLGNDYLTAMDRVPDLEAFAAVIYSSNFEYEVAHTDGPSVARRQNLSQHATPQFWAADEADAASLQPLHDLAPQPILEDEDVLVPAGPGAAEEPLSEEIVDVSAAVQAEAAAVSEELNSLTESAINVTDAETEVPSNTSNTTTSEVPQVIVSHGSEAALEDAWQKALAKEDGQSG